MADTCWADPLTRKERAELARAFARWCGRLWRAAQECGENGSDFHQDEFVGRVNASIEMSDLHLDVTERAEVTS